MPIASGLAATPRRRFLSQRSGEVDAEPVAVDFLDPDVDLVDVPL
jgi:hypothetical protein